MISVDNLRQLEQLIESNPRLPYFYETRKANGALFELLCTSLRFAFTTVPHYSKYSQKHKLRSDSFQPERLRELPILTKDDFLNHNHKLISRSAGICTMIASTGTTRAYATNVFLSREEIEARRLWSELKMKVAGINQERLFLHINFRRRNIRLPSSWFEVDVSYIPEDPWRVDHLKYRLMQKYDIPRKEHSISMMSLPTPWLLRLLTIDLKAEGIDTDSLGVRDLYISGGHVTSSLRDLAKENWGARIHNSYSLVESSCGGSNCQENDRYHLDKIAVPECVDPASGKDAVESEGSLLFTSLLPFQVAMPLVRYNTGDIAVLVNGKCSCGFDGYTIRLRGRSDYCVDLRDYVPRGLFPRFFSYLDVQEMLEAEETLLTLKPTIVNQKIGRSIIRAPQNPFLWFGVEALQTKSHAKIVVSVERPHFAPKGLLSKLNRALNDLYSEWSYLTAKNKVVLKLRLVRTSPGRSSKYFFRL